MGNAVQCLTSNPQAKILCPAQPIVKNLTASEFKYVQCIRQDWI